jgi:hypothetical protein
VKLVPGPATGWQGIGHQLKLVQAKETGKIFDRTKVVADHRDTIVLWGVKEGENFFV